MGIFVPFSRMTSSPWGNEKMKVSAKCSEIFRYKNGVLSWAFCCQGALKRGSAAREGEGQREDEGHCRNQRLSGHQGRGIRGQLQDGQCFGGIPCRSSRSTRQVQGDLDQSGKPPTLVRALPGPRPPCLLHSISSRITQRKKFCVTFISNHPEGDFETWKNVYYVSDRKKQTKKPAKGQGS